MSYATLLTVVYSLHTQDVIGYLGSIIVCVDTQSSVQHMSLNSIHLVLTSAITVSIPILA